MVNQQAKDVVFGYCSRYESLLTTCNINNVIPPLVRYLCINYYGNPESFTTINPFRILTKNNTIATVHPNYITDPKSNQGLFGKIKIKPGRLKAKKYIWKFKILNNTIDQIMIGIDTINDGKPFMGRNSHYFAIGNRSYKHNNPKSINFLSTYGQPVFLSSGGILTMELNETKKSLNYSFVVRDKDEPMRFGYRNVCLPSGIVFRLAVDLVGKDNSVELINFQELGA